MAQAWRALWGRMASPLGARGEQESGQESLLGSAQLCPPSSFSLGKVLFLPSFGSFFLPKPTNSNFVEQGMC